MELVVTEKTQGEVNICNLYLSDERMIGLTKGESNREGVWGTWYWATRVRVTREQLQPFTEVGEADIFEGSESR